MTLDALRCFCAIVETGSFREAAQRVHRSQPAVSQQLKNLEREMGHALFDRKQARPTPMGHLLFKRAQQILLSVQALSREVADFDEGAESELKVGTSDTTALYVLPKCVQAFSSAMPETRLVLVNRSSDAIAAQVVRGELDLGIVTLPQRHTELVEHPLFQQQLVLVAPIDHPLANQKRVMLQELGETPLLLLEETTRTGTLLREYFQQEAFTPQIALDSGSFEVIKRYVAEGVGVSFLPETVITQADHQLATVHVPGLPAVPIGVIWRKGTYRSRAEKLFVGLLEAHQATPMEERKSPVSLKVYAYKNCSTCRKAFKWMEEQGIDYQEIPIRETPPTKAELKRMLKAMDGNIRKLFNTSGGDYKALNLKEKLADMSESEVLDLLAGNGNLVKRPFVVGSDCLLVGFKPEEWGETLG